MTAILYTVVATDKLGPFRRVSVRRRRGDEPFYAGTTFDETIDKGDKVVIDGDGYVRRP